MTDTDIINDFEEIVEESRKEDRQEYYFKLRDTLDLIKKQQKQIEELEEK